MRFRSIGRGILTGFRNIIRNARMSFASIGTISICLMVLGITFVLLMNVRSFTEQMDDNLSVVVFLNADLTAEDKEMMGEKIAARPEVASVKYVSGDEAWENFKKELNDDQTLDADLTDYVNGNPLVNSDNFQIVVAAADAQASLIKFLQNLNGVRKINYSGEVSDILSNLVKVVAYVGIAMIAILIFVSMVLISNTVKLSVFMRKDEISIMKYLGASDAYVELPFLVEGILIGLIGSVLPCLLIYFGYDYLLEAATEYFGTLTALIQFVPLEQITYYLFPIYVILSIVVGTFGSLLSMKRYLRA